MITREKTVKEFEIVSEAMPHHVFTVPTETLDKAHRTLMADLKAVIAELQQHRNKGQENKPITQTHV